MTLPAGGHRVQIPAESAPNPGVLERFTSDPPAGRESLPIRYLAEDSEPELDPGAVIQTCANCGAPTDERKCKLICRCGYFLSCSDHY